MQGSRPATLFWDLLPAVCIATASAWCAKSCWNASAIPWKAIRPAWDGPSVKNCSTPTAIYVKPVLDLMKKVTVPGIAHITGGGFEGNIPRVLPDNCRVVIRAGSWEIPEIFRLLKREAALDDDEMHRTFNMGVGLVLIMPGDQADRARSILGENGLKSWIIGEVKPRSGQDKALEFMP